MEYLLLDNSVFLLFSQVVLDLVKYYSLDDILSGISLTKLYFVLRIVPSYSEFTGARAERLWFEK